MGFKKYDGSTWQSITPKKLKGVPYTGALPAVLTGTKAGYLHRYKIYGNTEQTGTPTPENSIMPSECGERTDNLFDKSNVEQNCYYDQDNKRFTVSAHNESDYIPVEAGKKYTLYLNKIKRGFGLIINLYDTSRAFYKNVLYISHPNGYLSVTPDIDGYIRFNETFEYATDYMFYEGSTALPYEPYGYKLPLTSAGQDVDIYIGDDTLSTEEYVNSGTGKIYRMVDGVLTPTDPPVPFPQIPTSANSTTISWAGEGLAPSEFDSIQEWVDIPTYTYTNGAWVEDN